MIDFFQSMEEDIQTPRNAWIERYLRDSLEFKRATEEKIRDTVAWIEASTSRLTDDLLQAEGRRTPEEYLAQRGYMIEIDSEHFLEWAPRFGEVDEEKQVVTVFSEATERVERFLHENEAPFRNLLPPVKTVLLAHELCHVLQDERGEAWHRDYSRREWRCLSELQARVFSGIFCGFSFPPMIYEKILTAQQRKNE